MIVYTVITNGYDNLKQPKQKVEGWEYIACVDYQTYRQNYWSNSIWKPKIIEHPQRYTKLMGLPEGGMQLYVDGSIEIIGDLQKFYKQYQCEIGVIEHPDRNNLKQEANAVIRLKKASALSVNKQVEEYTKVGYNGRGMYATGVMLRNMDSYRVRQMCLDWYLQTKQFTNRDQLSLGYVAWKAGISINKFHPNLFSNTFKIWRHLKR